MSRGADWHIKNIDHARRMVFIVDEDRGNTSVTNDADQVVPAVFEYIKAGNIDPVTTRNFDDVCEFRLFYLDSNGVWDELLHEHGRFIEFAPGRGITP